MSSLSQPRPARWLTTPVRSGFAILSVLILALLLTGCASLIPSPKTTYTNEHGETVTVDWREFPSITGTDAQAVLDGPTVEETEARADEILEAARATITEHLESLGVVNATGVEWNTDRSDAVSGDHWFPGTDNGYGGRSMLQIYNSPVWELEVTVPFNEWEGVLESVDEVLGDRGFADRYEYPHEQSGESGAQWTAEVIFSSGSEFVSVVVSDTTRSTEKLRDTQESSLAVAGISVFHGASAIKESDREEFARRAAPFAGLEHPNATT